MVYNTVRKQAKLFYCSVEYFLSQPNIFVILNKID